MDRQVQVGAADPGNPPAYEQALKTAQNTFRTAADRANQLAAGDPDAKTRRGEILLELADAQQLGKQFGDSVNTYNQILNEKLLPPREEEVVQDLAAAFHLAGNYAESDKICERFRTSYPASPLLPAVLFRYAENAYFSALAAQKLPNAADRQRETAKWLDETIKRYQAVVDKYPDSPNVNLARYGLGVAYYQKGDLEKGGAPCWSRSRRPNATATWRPCRTSWPTSSSGRPRRRPTTRSRPGSWRSPCRRPPACWTPSPPASRTVRRRPTRCSSSAIAVSGWRRC